MSRTITIGLEIIDILQILDALQSRAVAWEKTAALLSGKNSPEAKDEDDSEFANASLLDDEFFVPEECGDALEAEQIATNFRDIIKNLERQVYALKTATK